MPGAVRAVGRGGQNHLGPEDVARYCQVGAHDLDALLRPLQIWALVDVLIVDVDVAWVLSRGGGRLGLVDVVRVERDGTVPAFRTYPTIQFCDVWLERGAVAAFLGA